jgi:hypothetical protein
MSLDLFLNELRALKVTLAVDGEQLSVRAPKGIITKELGATITARKQEILQYLVGFFELIILVECFNRSGHSTND